DPAEIDGAGPPPQLAGAGVPYLMVPVRSLAAMRALRPRIDRWAGALAGFSDDVAVYAFSRETDEPGLDAHCRMFAPNLGVTEDPATGSAAGPLGGLLAHHAGRDGELRFRFEQGVEI